MRGVDPSPGNPYSTGRTRRFSTQGPGKHPERHAPGARSNPKYSTKSEFDAGVDVEALRARGDAVPAHEMKNGNWVRAYDAGERVGTLADGTPTSIMTVVSDAQGAVVTMHPGPPRVW